MFFFRKKRVKRAPTPFEEYLNSITPPKLVSLVCAQKREIKCPAMFHYAVLINARSFVRQIEVSDLEFKDPLNQALNSEGSARLNFDDVAIQVIAFLYYWAMADFLKNENLDEYGGHQTQRTGGDEYYSSLKVALTFTDDLTTELIKSKTHPTYIRNRVVSYAIAQSMKKNVLDMARDNILGKWVPREANNGIAYGAKNLARALWIDLAITIWPKTLKTVLNNFYTEWKTNPDQFCYDHPRRKQPAGNLPKPAEVPTRERFTVWQKLVRALVVLAILAVPLWAAYLLERM